MAGKRRRKGEPRPLPVRVSDRGDQGRALEVGGVTQSVTVPKDGPSAPDAPAVEEEPLAGPYGGYWGLMLPPGCPRHALLLGFGGGTVATLLARRCLSVAITGVERDPAVIAAARQDFSLDALPRLTLAQADAFAWMDETEVAGPRFDLVVVDLYEGGRLTMGTLTTRFLRQVAARLTPEGVATINLMVTGRTSEQIHRIERVFTILRRLRTRGNLILHLSPRGAGATS
ncbi:MAG TPA: fused MFS/spermidine synthase [Ktedonobacterales bacterium]